jgi:hypothetical protein
VGVERWDDQVGSVADEAARLLESLRRTAAESAVGESVGHDGADAAGPAAAAGSTSASASAGAGTTGAAGAAGAGAGEGAAERGMPGATPAGAGTGGAGAGEGAAERGMPGATSAGGPDRSAHDPFCTWCPLCRGAAVVRSLSPETLGKLADLATLAATVLTDLASSRPAGGPPASHPDHRAPGTGGATARPGQRSRRPGPAQSRPIPVSDADDSQEAPRG